MVFNMHQLLSLYTGKAIIPEGETLTLKTMARAVVAMGYDPTRIDEETRAARRYDMVARWPFLASVDEAALLTPARETIIADLIAIAGNSFYIGRSDD